MLIAQKTQVLSCMTSLYRVKSNHRLYQRCAYSLWREGDTEAPFYLYISQQGAAPLVKKRRDHSGLWEDYKSISCSGKTVSWGIMVSISIWSCLEETDADRNPVSTSCSSLAEASYPNMASLARSPKQDGDELRTHAFEMVDPKPLGDPSPWIRWMHSVL